MPPTEGVCPTHSEFARRLDERWREHKEEHTEKQDDICEKFKGIFERLDKQNQKLNWVLGGLAVICPVLMIFVQILVSHLGGKP